MKSTYIVKSGQNIYDVAVQIYGSIEGLFDLLISNESLSSSAILQPGMELNYHTEYVINDGIREELDSTGEVVANGDCYGFESVDHNEVLYILSVRNYSDDVPVISLSGTGIVNIDWGYGKPAKANLSSSSWFNTSPSSHDESYIVRIYGIGEIDKVKLTEAEITATYRIEAKTLFEIVEEEEQIVSRPIVIETSAGDYEVKHGDQIDISSSSPVFYAIVPEDISVEKFCLFSSSFGEQELLGIDILNTSTLENGSKKYAITIPTVSKYNKQIFRIKIS